MSDTQNPAATDPTMAAVVTDPAAAAAATATPATPAQEIKMNAAQEAAIAAIKPNFDKFTDKKVFKFHFKKDELGNKRPTVELTLPIPSVEGIVDIITKEGNEKELELLLEAIENVITSQARTVVNSDETITQATFPMDSVLWGFIANMDKAERRGGGISKETWEAFCTDYVAVMPAVTGKTADQVGRAAAIFADKFTKVRSNKPVLTKLKDQLGIYVTNSTKAEDFTDCVEFLTDKADKLLAVDDSALADNL